jgi:hypothetical protein
MNIVYKFKLADTFGPQGIIMPLHAKILSVAEQGCERQRLRSLFAWALFDDAVTETATRKIVLLPTGLGPKLEPPFEFIDTIHTLDGLVIHVFDCGNT